MSETWFDDSPTREDVAAAVDGAVAELLAAAGVSGPPVDALALARDHLGLEVVRVEASRLDRRPRSAEQRIELAARDRPEQDQLAVAAALGARAKSDLLRRLGIPEEGRRGLTGVSLANL